MTTISKTGKTETGMTLQKMFIESYDRELNQNSFELLSYDPLVRDADGTVVGGLQRITTKAMGDYIANDIEIVGDTTYIGFENLDGDYFIKRIVGPENASKSIRFATIINN